EATALASYVVSEMIAKSGKPFTDGEFIKDCIIKVSVVVCPDRRNVFSNISQSANTVAERVVELSKDLEEQLCEKGKAFSAYSIALDESTDLVNTLGLQWHYLAGLTTDRAPVMIGKKNGLVVVVQKKSHQSNTMHHSPAGTVQ
ncbi:SCND3 protein, partial [Polyodon spathula]|nr:SCND3 protein [Polyodon spathula]